MSWGNKEINIFHNGGKDMSKLVESLYKELELKTKVIVEGVNVNPAIFKNLDLGGAYQEQVHCLFEMDHQEHVGIQFPCNFTSPTGIKYPFNWDTRSRFFITFRNAEFYLNEGERELFPVQFDKRPKYYALKTSDGTLMSHVGVFSGWEDSGTINIAYSNECALKDKGLDCLFCNANATKNTYAEKENITWKNPNQIGETVKAAMQLDNLKHVNITGGFIPERREVEYYIDVAEAIQNHTGLEDFNGTAVIGAPADLKVIDKYKEAGYSTIAINLEVWDENIFKTICPGKHQDCGGRQHWLDALEYAVTVFGYGNVRSSFVAGIEPKERTIEGIQYLSERGIIPGAGIWNPNPGSALEGHRTPTPEWHYDLALKAFGYYKKAGFTYQQLVNVSPAPHGIFFDFYRIENELLPVFHK